MGELKFSPALRPYRGKAPEPSPALRALQGKGFELSANRNTPTSVSPQSDPAHDLSLRISPLSIISTPSGFGPPPSTSKPELLPEFAWRRRRSSAGSIETTVTGILNLYTNLSRQSLRSEYEEITPYPDSEAGSEEDVQLRPTFHQPKAQAYRDTIAPLLEHQFSDSSLTVPVAPSPMSMASMPTLMHPEANVSVPSLRLTPDVSPSLQPNGHKSRVGASLSNTSIQITPDMSPHPPTPPVQLLDAESVRKQAEQNQVVLEVPDVRDAESWYDQPLSPVSPDDPDYRNTVRDSQQSAVSPHSPESQAQPTSYFRSLALESLSPPIDNVKTSPNLRAVKVVDSHDSAVPPPLNLDHSRSLVSNRSGPVHQSGVVDGSVESGTKSQHTSPALAEEVKNDPIEGPMRTYLTPPPEKISESTKRLGADEQLSIEEIYRPGSGFSESSDSFIIHDTISGQVKAILRDKFRKKKTKGSGSKISNRTSTARGGAKVKDKKFVGMPTMTKNAMTAFEDDVESYKYPYKSAITSSPRVATGNELEPARQVQSLETHSNSAVRANSSVLSTTGVQDSRRSSVFSGPGPSVSGSPQLAMQERNQPGHSGELRNSQDAPLRSPTEEVKPITAIPLTRYQKYGVEIWYESNKKKRQQERQRLKKEAAKAEKIARQEQTKAARKVKQQHVGRVEADPLSSAQGVDKSRPGFYRQISHMHTMSNGSTDGSLASTAPEGEILGAAARQRRSGGAPTSAAGYNNDLFEASGGKKKNGLASRLMMSSEEKRKKKVKESITIVGGAKMGSSFEEGRGLVNIL